MSEVGANRDQRENQSQKIDPERRVHAGAEIFSKAKLQQQGSESDCCHDN